MSSYFRGRTIRRLRDRSGSACKDARDRWKVFVTSNGIPENIIQTLC